jgi:hypothetical protein
MYYSRTLEQVMGRGIGGRRSVEKPRCRWEMLFGGMP